MIIKMKKIIKPKIIIYYWLPPIGWAFVIFFLSSYPTGVVSRFFWKDFIIKKTAHFIEYAILAMLLYRAFRQAKIEKGNAGLLAILISALYGLTDEFHQILTPGRIPRLTDVVFDTIGAAIGIYILWNLLPRAPKKLKIWAEKLRLI